MGVQRGHGALGPIDVYMQSWKGPHCEHTDLLSRGFGVDVVSCCRPGFWDNKHSPFARDRRSDFPQRLSFPRPDIQFDHSHPEIVLQLEALEHAEAVAVTETRKILKSSTTDSTWDLICGSLSDRAAGITPYVS